jgi:hypothetical protein
VSASTRRFVRHDAEMVAAMFLPTFAVIALLGGDLVTDVGVLLVIEHVAMLLSMLGAMLLRSAEYTGHRHGGVERAVSA